jgi:hypothetical protein
VFPYVIGDAYGGGTLAYILQSGDPGYISGEDHGLIATVADVSSSAIWTSGVGSLVSTSSLLGTGNQNTVNIIIVDATLGIAARLCGDLIQGGYSDWYLPSQDELNKLFINRVAISGFTAGPYWSSTQENTIDGGFTQAFLQNFTSGNQNYASKGNPLNVRAIRSF